MQHYDCIVIGGGFIGSQTTEKLSQNKDKKIAMFEQYPEGPSQGASFGETRIVRPVEWEVDAYAPMVLRSLEIYHSLNELCKQRNLPPVFYETGGLYGGPINSDIFLEAARCAKQNKIPHDILTPAQAKLRFPILDIPDNYRLVHDHVSGILVPERMLELHYQLAREKGAELHFETRLEKVESLDDGKLLITTNKGIFTTNKLIVGTGAWSGKLLENMGLDAVIENSTPERGYVAWIKPALGDGGYRMGELPVCTIGENSHDNFFSIPIFDEFGTPGLKTAATNHRKEYDDNDPWALRYMTDIEPVDDERVREYTDKFFPGTKGSPTIKAASCVWTENNSKTSAMFLGFYPGDQRIIIACGDNGEGARLSGAVAEIIADLTMGRKPKFDLSPFALDRPELADPDGVRYAREYKRPNDFPVGPSMDL